MSEETKKGPGIPVFRIIVVIAIALLISIYWKEILNNAIFVGIMILFLYGWTKSETNGWIKMSMVFLLLLNVFAMNAGESFYIKNQTLPWFYGFDDTIAGHNDYGPVFLLILGLIFVPILIRFLGTGLIAYANSKDTLKTKIPAIILGILVMLFSIHTAAEIGGYMHKTKGYSIGSKTVGWASSIGSDAGKIVSEILDDYAKDNNAEIELKQKSSN